MIHSQLAAAPRSVLPPNPGGNLGTALDLHGPPPIDLALNLVDQVASGLVTTHQVGLVHGDICPAHVFLQSRIPQGGILPGGILPGGSHTFTAFLADSGLAVLGSRRGTHPQAWHFMAPEVRAGHAPTLASDAYALGCLLWVVLSGRPPLHGGPILGPRDSLMVGDSLQVASLNHVLATALAADPGRRYPSARAFSNDLRVARRLAGSPGSIAVARLQLAAPPPEVPGWVWAIVALVHVMLAVLGWSMLTGLGA